MNWFNTLNDFYHIDDTDGDTGFFHEGFFQEGFFFTKVSSTRAFFMRAFSTRALHEGFTRGLYTRFFSHDTHEAYETDEAPPSPPEAHETHEAHEALWWCHPSIKDRLQSSSIPQNSYQCLIRCPLLHCHKIEAFRVQQKRKLKCPHFRTKLRVPLFIDFFLV